LADNSRLSAVIAGTRGPLVVKTRKYLNIYQLSENWQDTDRKSGKF